MYHLAQTRHFFRKAAFLVLAIRVMPQRISATQWIAVLEAPVDINTVLQTNKNDSVQSNYYYLVVMVRKVIEVDI